MIVRDGGDVLHLITQPDHAALARRIMDRWIADDLPSSPRRESILRAVEEHDHGWLEVDAAPIVDATTGRIADFMTAPLSVRQGIWPRGVTRLSADPWAAALVAQHAIHVYARYTADPGWQAFFAGMATLRSKFLAESGLPLEVLLEDYRFLRLGDLISLAFCNAWTDEHHHGPYVIRCAGTHVTISPDPFGGVRIPIDVQARLLAKRRYRNDADAAGEWIAAREVRIDGGVRGAGVHRTISPA
jgi:hypothetical protein